MRSEYSSSRLPSERSRGFVRFQIIFCSASRFSSIRAIIARSHAKYFTTRALFSNSPTTPNRSSVRFITACCSFAYRRYNSVGIGKVATIQTNPTRADHPIRIQRYTNEKVIPNGTESKKKNTSRLFVIASLHIRNAHLGSYISEDMRLLIRPKRFRSMASCPSGAPAILTLNVFSYKACTNADLAFAVN